MSPSIVGIQAMRLRVFNACHLFAGVPVVRFVMF